MAGSPAEDQDFELTVGDARNIEITAYQPDGVTVYDLTPVTGITWAMKRRFFDAAALVTKTIGSGIVVTNAVSGIFTVTLDPSDTASLDAAIYEHEAQLEVGSDPYTITRGRLTLKSAIIN